MEEWATQYAIQTAWGRETLSGMYIYTWSSICGASLEKAAQCGFESHALLIFPWKWLPSVKLCSVCLWSEWGLTFHVPLCVWATSLRNNRFISYFHCSILCRVAEVSWFIGRRGQFCGGWEWRGRRESEGKWGGRVTEAFSTTCKGHQWLHEADPGQGQRVGQPSKEII